MDIPPASDEFESRRLCPDGACTGIIGPDGYCTECGKFVGPAKGSDKGGGTDGLHDPEQAGDGERDADQAGAEGGDTGKDGLAPVIALPKRGADGVQAESATGGEGEGEGEGGEGGEDDFENRRLCPDGACTGIIGPDGRCTECGRKVDD